MPDRSSDSSPDPEPRGPDDNTVDVLRERIDCMLDDNKNGTLVLDVFGIDPPCERNYFRAHFQPSHCHQNTHNHISGELERVARGEKREKEKLFELMNLFHHFNAEIIFITLNYARATGDTPTVACF